MNPSYVESETYENLDYYVQKLLKGEYDECTFKNCNFADSDLSGVSFADSRFEDC